MVLKVMLVAGLIVGIFFVYDSYLKLALQQVSPYASNLYLSCLWQFEGGAAALEGLSLAVGIAIVEALKELGLKQLKLKWPNDVLSDGKKLAGILVEMVGDASGTLLLNVKNKVELRPLLMQNMPLTGIMHRTLELM